MFKKMLSIIIVLGLCCATGVMAQEQKGSLFSDWLKSIQKKIDQVKPKKTLPTSNAVAGIRGAKQDAQTKLYWKGKKREEIVTEEELGKFKACVDLADKGDCTSAVRELEVFMKQYPDSALMPDVKKTLDLAKVVAVTEKREPVKEEKKDDNKDEKKEPAKDEKQN